MGGGLPACLDSERVLPDCELASILPFRYPKLRMLSSNGQFCAPATPLLLVACSILMVACAPTDTMRIDAGTNASVVATSSTDAERESNSDLAKLEKLWSERQIAASLNKDYPIGPGDVLTVSVPDIEQLEQRRVRVTTRGTIELPLLGVIPAGGLGEDGLEAEIDARLQKYMYQPQASVFVDEYHNRAVAVVGAVNHPGLVLLASPSESLLDVITQAGGLSGAAADEVILIPSRPGTIPHLARSASFANSTPADQTSNGSGENQVAATDLAEPRTAAQVAAKQAGNQAPPVPNEPSELMLGDGFADGSAISSRASTIGGTNSSVRASSLPGSADIEFAPEVARGARVAAGPLGATRTGELAGQLLPPDPDEALQLAGSDQAVTLKLKGANLTGMGKYVNLPMRPGDVLIIPGGGDVMVVGWVHLPGRFQVGSGLTVLGAIGAAGGPMYAAKTDSIVLIRTGQHGGKVTIPINMEQITRGQAADLPVQANDVIDVPYSGLRIGPYIFYSILTKMGIGGPVIPY